MPFLTTTTSARPGTISPRRSAVGNGGFSLRSRRLLEAGADARITDLHPEDAALCRTYRELLASDYGVRFAPLALARRFAYENEPPSDRTFGFHGPKNLPAVLDAQTLAEWIHALPDAFFTGRDSRRLARSLLRHRLPKLAQLVIERRRAAGRPTRTPECWVLLRGRCRGWPRTASTRRHRTPQDDRFARCIARWMDNDVSAASPNLSGCSAPAPGCGASTERDWHAASCANSAFSSGPGSRPTIRGGPRWRAPCRNGSRSAAATSSCR